MQPCIIYKKILLLFIIAVTTQGYSQLSNKHFIPPLTNANSNSAIPSDQYIYLSTPSTTDIEYTITPVGQVSSITGILSSTNPAIIPLGSGNGQLFMLPSQTSVVTNNKGYIIEATGSVYASVRVNAGSQAGALVSKGLSALGTTFRVGSFTNENPQDNYLNFVSVMATEDNTQVIFDDLPSGLIITNYSGTTPITVTLNEGESYTIATNSIDSFVNRDGLIGCLVTSDKPIVVNCGSANGSFHNGNGRDYGIDQIVDITKVGTEYIFVKGEGSNNWENVLIVAHTNNTTISINGNASITTINAGEYYLIEGNQYSAFGNMYVQTSEPVFAYQGIGADANSEANQGMFFVPPLSCEARGDLDNIANINNIGSTNYTGGVTIITKTGATVTVTSSTSGNVAIGSPSTVTGKSDYVTYKVTGLTGNISVQSTDELYCAYYNQNNSASSGSFYSGFPSAPEINFDLTFTPLGICIPNATLEIANMSNFSSIEWYYDDGTGFAGTGVSTLQYVPTLSGTYKVIGILLCTGDPLESLEVPVSICPDDIDVDGIIDNIDIDNDNDGILNCIESNGNYDINLSNTASGSMPVGGYTYTGNITPIGNIATIPFIGNSDGTFLSDTPNKNGTVETSVTYDLNFNTPLNLMVEYATSSSLGTSLLTNDQEFTIRFPNTRTITLLDPDDQLLVDTNFDGIYETGVTQFSAFEIRFKLNASSLAIGSGTFSFLANGVDSFTYIHKNNSDTNSNQASFKISATCVAKDTDLDGIEDALDLDSDNDGIPDFIENDGSLVALSGIDADLNGLDDIYDINATPLDSDNDAVFDFYDLDSDNDGIYDLIETGQLGTLSDTNLDGIEDGPTYGVNGWADAAETSPDSNLIGYTLNDLDNDAIFSYLDLDSDGDTCSDVIEAGFSDANGDDLLGDTTPVTTNTFGLVTSASDGYALPNSDYLDFAPITITTQPVDTEVCESANTTISIATSTIDTIEWELSTDGINWNPISDDAIYSGTQTVNLNISNTPVSYNTYQYRAFLNVTGNSCGFYSDEIELTVHPLPVLNSPSTYSQCDDETNDGIALFNLTLDAIKEEIDSDYIAKNLIFTYYLDSNANTIITDPQNYQNPTPFTPEIVWIGVEDTNGCFNTVPITLTVTPSSAALVLYDPPSIHQCDDGLDNRDGISTFNMENIENHIINTVFSTFNVTVHFYESLIDAELETNEIPDITNHQNINSLNSQSIWVRVKSDLGNNCLGLKGFDDLLIVEALPTANPIPDFIECDNDTDPTNGFSFNTTNLETDLLNGQSLTDVSVSYFDAIGNQLTDFNGTPISSPFPNTYLFTPETITTLSASQTITARVTNNNTAAPNGPCYDETTIEFRVDVQPIANQVPLQIVCDGDSGDIDDDGYFPFDTSTFTNTILGSQLGSMDVYYDYIDENGTLITDSSSLPNPLISENQTIIAEVINPNNLSCTAITNIELIVNPLPEFTVDTPRIVCSSDPSFSVTLDLQEANITETFTYEWYWDSLDGLTTNQFISNDREIIVSNPGTYYITLTKTDGTSCSRTRDIFVDASEQATITLDDIDISSPSYNHSVSIKDPSLLGFGEYDYALQEENSSFIVFQDEPVFNNIQPGFYTLHIRDKVCPTTMLDIAVIGHNQFFTPNGDGYYERWKIEGIGATNQPSSVVLIFDRYGKLLKQLSPLEPGWDGTFNGTKLPTDDYWFRVYLEDGREFSGHFTLKR